VLCRIGSSARAGAPAWRVGRRSGGAGVVTRRSRQDLGWRQDQFSRLRRHSAWQGTAPRPPRRLCGPRANRTSRPSRHSGPRSMVNRGPSAPSGSSKRSPWPPSYDSGKQGLLTGRWRYRLHLQQALLKVGHRLEGKAPHVEGVHGGKDANCFAQDFECPLGRESFPTQSGRQMRSWQWVPSQQPPPASLSPQGRTVQAPESHSW
jgi:hypothetical protein